MVYSVNVKFVLIVWYMWRKVVLKVLVYNKFIWGYFLNIEWWKKNFKVYLFIYCCILIYIKFIKIVYIVLNMFLVGKFLFNLYFNILVLWIILVKFDILR